MLDDVKKNQVFCEVERDGILVGHCLCVRYDTDYPRSSLSTNPIQFVHVSPLFYRNFLQALPRRIELSYQPTSHSRQVRWLTRRSLCSWMDALEPTNAWISSTLWRVHCALFTQMTLWWVFFPYKWRVLTFCHPGLLSLMFTWTFAISVRDPHWIMVSYLIVIDAERNMGRESRS